MRFCTVFLQPVFLPQGVALNNWHLRRTVEERGVRSQDFEILFLGFLLDIYWKSHILSILQEKIAIWPNNKINVFTDFYSTPRKVLTIPSITYLAMFYGWQFVPAQHISPAFFQRKTEKTSQYIVNSCTIWFTYCYERSSEFWHKLKNWWHIV